VELGSVPLENMEIGSFYKNKTVLVTGHSGFKGSWLLSILEYFGANCIGYSLLPNSNPSHFELLNTKGKSYFSDLNDYVSVQAALNETQPEIVFHLAAQPLVRESYRDPIYTYQTNVMGTLALLQAVRNCSSVKALIIITTDKVYENKEWDYPYRENDQLGGYDMYSSSKACAEILVNSFKRSFLNEDSILVATARAGNVIGGGDWSSDRLIPDIVKATANRESVVIRNPDSVRPWQHILDCLYGYLLLGQKLLQGEGQFAKAWNFSPYNSEACSVRQVTNLAVQSWSEVKVEFGKPADLFHEAKTLKLDNSQSVATLGWRPIWNTEKSVQKTIEWYKEFYSTGKLLTQPQIEEYFSAHGILKN